MTSKHLYNLFIKFKLISILLQLNITHWKYDGFACMYMQVFRESAGDIFVTPNNAQPVFMTSLHSLFSDGVVNWGRVVALLAFSGSLAAQCVETEMPFLVNQITDWATAYISTNLASWIHDNGGWVS